MTAQGRGKPTSVKAGELGLTGRGDETAAFQAAIDKLAQEAPAVLELEPGKTYTVTTLAARHGVTIRGDHTVIANPRHGVADQRYLFTVSDDVDVTLRGLTLSASCLFLGTGSGVLRLIESTLTPAAADSDPAVFFFKDHSRFAVQDSDAERLSSLDQPAMVKDQASIEWIGGRIIMDALRIVDSATGKFDVDVYDNHALDLHGQGLVLGRPSGTLWQALCGTASEFKQARNHPALKHALEAWQRHNRTQDVHVELRVKGGDGDEYGIRGRVRTYGCATLQVRDSALSVIVAGDESTVHMDTGKLHRFEATGLSRCLYTNVDVTITGSDDPERPSSHYYEGNHCIECSRMYNDLVPRVEFTGGTIDFAGDDCLNRLPEARALQLMEVVHDHGSAFPDMATLQGFLPETCTPGAALDAIKGAAGAVHNKGRTDETVPFDFRESGFTWKGPYDPAVQNRVGDVCEHEGLLYVCNRPNMGVTPNAIFRHWQVFSVAFRNETGYLQVARRVCRDGTWSWERRQALGEWAGFKKRERGNPIVTYQVHLVLRDATVIRRANTWSFAGSPSIPTGNAGYDYVLSSFVPNVAYNTENNVVECHNVDLVNIGMDAMPIRGLSLGPHRHMGARHVFNNVRIKGESIGMPVCFRIDTEPLRPDARVVLKDITADYAPGRYTPMMPVSEVDTFSWYEFMAERPAWWQGIETYLSRFIDREHSDARFSQVSG